ncbi:MAG TPA: copper amine oxidase N-terminal domain-containing protein, partial [Caldisericia bacterium]|nr:copper amine oxidase N-terminal domain-containing protein [Caldisericia bacterium]
YEASTKVISFVTEAGKKVELKIGSKTAVVDGAPVQLQAAPQIVKGKTMIPLRFVSEALGANVNYSASNKQITLTKPGCK